MAVTFISHGYDTTVGNPYTEASWADAFPSIGTATYGVRSATDWKVTAVAGQDRTVSINAGRGFGHGITDKTFENETIQLDTISSGSRWDLIAARRDWTPTGGETKFVKVNGGATSVIPGGRIAGPGNIDDQPLALVQVTAGQTQPTAIIGLRTWTGDGGGIVAEHDLVRSFLDAVGTRLWIDGIDWVRRAGANDTPEWKAADEATFYTPLATAGYSTLGEIATEPAGAKRRVTVDLTFQRTGANLPNYVKNDSWTTFATPIPVAARGNSPIKYPTASLIGGGNNIGINVALNPATGQVSIRAVDANHALNNGSLFTVNATYYV